MGKPSAGTRTAVELAVSAEGAKSGDESLHQQAAQRMPTVSSMAG